MVGLILKKVFSRNIFLVNPRKLFVGITGDWQGAWLLLSNRKLFYKTNDDMIRELDLRKARLIDLQKIMDGDCIPQVLEEGPSMLIDCQKTCFYFRSWISSDTQVHWIIFE